MLVGNPHREDIVARVDQGGDVESERRIAADVLAGALTVDEYIGATIGAFKFEEKFLALHIGGNVQVAAIPVRRPQVIDFHIESPILPVLRVPRVGNGYVLPGYIIEVALFRP